MMDGADLDPETRMILAGQRDIEQAIIQAGLARDPYRHPMKALHRSLGLMLQMHQNTRKVMAETLDRAEALHDPAKPLGHQLALVISKELFRFSSCVKVGTSVLVGCLFIACVLFTAGLLSMASYRADQKGIAAAFAFASTAGGHSDQWLGFIQHNSWDAMINACSKASLAFVTNDGRRACYAPVYLDAGPPQLEVTQPSTPKH